VQPACRTNCGGTTFASYRYVEEKRRKTRGVRMEGLFLLVPVCIGVVSLLVFGIIAWQLARGFAEWSRNNASPVESVPAKVVAKRTETSGRMNGGSVWTTYFVTFELEDGQRPEYAVRGREYGVLVEGDRGTLTHQGTRYKGFQRE
jgi:hypothetical protein